MNIQSEKLGLIEWIARLNDSAVIEKLIRFRKEYDTHESDWWNEISSLEKESIERGLKDIEEGRIVAHEEVKKIYEKYL
jgi:hypothetical protein